MLACKYHSFPIYFSFEFNVVSIERKNFPIEVKLVNASMYQKRSDTVAQFILLILQTEKLLFLQVVPCSSS
jgi:hypothetical protein